MKQEYHFLVRVFKDITGIDLSYYNQAQVVRRLEPMLQKYGTFQQLALNMTDDSRLVQEAMNRITIHFSEFFRDRSFWTTLTRLVKELSNKTHHINAWSVGCGNGEEAWTLAFVLAEALPQGNYSIVASDIDPDALKTASGGLYSRLKGMSVAQAQVSKYFTEHSQGYKVKDMFHKQVTFFKHDLIKDPFPHNLHLILCRNVMIYFRQGIKEKVGEKMAAALVDGGLLCLGSTEYIDIQDFSGRADNNIYIK
jgi:chemotaxis protein methyltransferase CheR